MVRLGLGLLGALAAISAASAQDALPHRSGPGDHVADTRCAALGDGFFAVSGSAACMKISGHISAGVGFASRGALGQPASYVPATGSFTDMGVTADSRFDTPIGPGRIYVHLNDQSGSRWAFDAQ
ncbi:MAG TPA: hypothetical protein VEK35_03945 [Roseiarcus sp.]|nr:hypothetical protein [Roseiarcus sp.]